MKSVNKCTLLGNVGKDPDVRSASTGTTIATLTLATSDRKKDQQGNWQDETTWHSLKAFNKTAEIIRDYVKKGSKLYIEGKLTTNSWEDKASGEKKYRTEILINELVLLSEKEPGQSPRQSGSSSYQRPAPVTVPDDDSDIPF